MHKPLVREKTILCDTKVSLVSDNVLNKITIIMIDEVEKQQFRCWFNFFLIIKSNVSSCGILNTRGYLKNKFKTSR